MGPESAAGSAERPVAQDRTTIVRSTFLGAPVLYTVVDAPEDEVVQPWHTHSGEEHVIVLDGWVEVGFRHPAGVGAVRATAGQSLTVPAGVGHSLAARGLFESLLPGDADWPAVCGRSER